MNLQELRDVQDRERSTDSLQELPDDFYEEVSAYIRERKAERAEAAREAEDPFSLPTVSRLTDEIETAEAVATAIYERRMGKLLTQASLAAAEVGGDVEGLTTEEQELFEDLVDRIHANKQRVLDVLTSDAPPGDVGTDEGAAAASGAGDGGGEVTGDDGSTQVGSGTDERGGRGPARDETVDAAAVMGGEDAPDGEDTLDGENTLDGDEDGGDDGGDDGAGAPSADESDVDGSGVEATGVEGTGADDTPTGGDAAGDGTAGDDDLTDHTTIQVTQDVGEVFGVDERVYSLAADDVVTLPSENAEALLERGAATRLDEQDAT